MKDKKHLPIIKENTTTNLLSASSLSSEKEYVSYSELTLWMECSYRHYLKYLKKISIGDKSNQHSAFGACCHTITENFLETKNIDNEIMSNAIKEFDKELIEIKKRDMIPVDLWDQQVPLIMAELPNFMFHTFGNDWSYVGAEVELLEPIDKTTKLFKGYIDGIIKLADGKYFILDWKTTATGWDEVKKTNKIKAMQLAFYKHFWSKKLNIPMEEIRTGFVLLKRTPKTPTEPRCELVEITIENEDIEFGLKKILEMQRTLNKNLFSKNKKACFFCEYKNTQYCR